MASVAAYTIIAIVVCSHPFLIFSAVSITVLQVENFIVHPKYIASSLTSSDHDIALLKLAHPVRLTSHVGFICLPVPRYPEPANGTLCTVTGWGHLQFGSEVSPDLLHSAQVPLVLRRCWIIITTVRHLQWG